MKLIKTISKTELSETYWREKRRKKDVNLTPSELRNLGEKNLLLMNALEDAMNENLSSEYEKIIQLYFLNLQKESSEK